MSENRLVFKTRCATTVIDYDRCEPALKQTMSPACGFACVKADRTYDRNILKIEGFKPVLVSSPEATEKNSNESLSWEYACRAVGGEAIRTTVDYPGLDEYRKKIG